MSLSPCPRCDCPLSRNGTDCSTEVPKPELQLVCSKHGHTSATCSRTSEPGMCVNACNGRGKCIGGFCHCKPGFYGVDCALSLNPGTGKPELLAGQGYTVRSSGPRIYVYELPPHNNVYLNMDRLDRPLMYMLLQRLLSAGVRVADPADADLFYVPVRVRLQYDSVRVNEAVSYIRTVWPYWNATGGDRHLFVHTGDWGRDELTEDAQLLTRNSTWLTHWGLARDHVFADWQASHRPGKDIVLPLLLQQSLLTTYRITRMSPLHPAGPKDRKRGKVLFFAGRICGSRAPPLENGTYPNCPDVLGTEDAYSAATRQRSHYYHHNRTDWKVVTATKSYASDLLTSRFCLAPSGGGMGKRSVVSVLMGCIPVTVTDGLLQPFEPEMRWDTFAVDVRERDIPLLHELLGGLRPEQVAGFQANLRCAAQHLFWSSLYGSLFGEDGRYDAFETLMQILRMRVRYPGVAPEEYVFVDRAFAAFMRCQPPPKEGSDGAAGGQVQQQQQGRAAGGAGGKVLAGAAGALDSGKRELEAAFGSRGAGGTGPGEAGWWPRPLQAAGRGQGAGAGAGPGGKGSELCTLSELPSRGTVQCSKCPRRRGRLLNPGGTVCCATKELAKCPRFWD